jgi:hypothetical protein
MMDDVEDNPTIGLAWLTNFVALTLVNAFIIKLRQSLQNRLWALEGINLTPPSMIPIFSTTLSRFLRKWQRHEQADQCLFCYRLWRSHIREAKK